MQELWCDLSKFNYWLVVELAVLKAKVNLSYLAADVYERIAKFAKFSIERIEEIEEEVGHDLAAFVQCVQEFLIAAGLSDRDAGEFHKDTTSYDTEDPAFMLMLRKSAELIMEALQELRAALMGRALQHSRVLFTARTHGQDAEPDSFGRFLLVFVEELDFAIAELKHICSTALSVGKVSSAVGNYGDMDPLLEEETLDLLGLKPVAVSTQIVQRNRHATYLNWIATTGGCLEQMAKTFWQMMHSRVDELREPRKATRKGSSAMPHKRNPNVTERIYGLVRMLRAYAQAGLEDIATLEHREISQSSVERIIFPDATSLLYYLLKQCTKIVSGMEVREEQMLSNLNDTHGVWASKRLKIALLNEGVNPEEAYRYVQTLSFRATDEKVHLRNLLQTEPIDPELGTAEKLLGADQLDNIFDPWAYIEPGVKMSFARMAA